MVFTACRNRLASTAIAANIRKKPEVILNVVRSLNPERTEPVRLLDNADAKRTDVAHESRCLDEVTR
jgi:hypothetical protein